jgi:uncharacterized glyoxalase superfamily protein PhnB
MAAYRWLEKAFGFEPHMLIVDEAGKLVHSQMKFGDSMVMIGGEWEEGRRTSPKKVGGANTQSVHVHMDGDIDTHCARARAAGAEIVAEPQDQFYGDRTYRARDPEGHIWTFGQTVKEMTPDEWDKGMPGIKTKMFS